MTFTEWRKSKEIIIKDANRETLEVLFKNAYLHGVEHSIEKEDRRAFIENRNSVSLLNDTLVGLNRYFVSDRDPDSSDRRTGDAPRPGPYEDYDSSGRKPGCSG